MERDNSFDALRGIAIAAVVAIHVNSYLFSPTNSLFYRQTLNFAVPAFLFISGYFVANKKLDTFDDYKEFLVHRLNKVLVPYLFWSILILLIGAAITHVFNVKSILFKLMTGGALTPYYFIILIVQLYMLTPVFQYINKRSYGFILIVAINVFSLFASYLMRLYGTPFFSSLVAYAMPFYTWIIFYELGIIYRNFDNHKSSKREFISVGVLTLLSLLLSMFEARYIILKYNNLGFAASAVKFSSFLYSVGIIAGFAYIRQKVNTWPKLLVSLGNYSFGIFLIHMLAIYTIARYSKELFLNWGILSQIIFVFVVLFICYIIIYISKKIFPRCEFLGF